MELRIFFGLGMGEMSGARVLVRCFFVRLGTGDGLFCRSLLNDGRFCRLFSQPPSTQVPGICSPVLLFDVTTYLVYIWSRFFGGSFMENVVPQNDVVVFLQFACCLFFPSPPSSRHSGLFSLCAPQRRGEKEGKTCAFPFPPNIFYSSNPLKKWQKKEIPIQSTKLCVYSFFSPNREVICCLL